MTACWTGDNRLPCTIRCVVKYIIAKIQSGTAIFLFPGGQESSIYSPYVPRMCPSASLLAYLPPLVETKQAEKLKSCKMKEG